MHYKLLSPAVITDLLVAGLVLAASLYLLA